MVHFPRFAPVLKQVTNLKLAGLPHSDTPGSQLIASSPRLFADCRVLLRLSSPRHPSDALILLTLPFQRPYNLLNIIRHD